MSCCATRTRRIIIETVIASALIMGIGGVPVAWSADPDAYEAPFEGPVHLDDSSLPDPTRTPGDAFERAKRKDLCDEDADKVQRAPTSALCDSVFTDYRIPPEARFQYKCSYLVPLGVGGAATQMNVWPQPVAEAAFKEKLDIELHNQVCSEDVSPVQAQREIVSDWVKTYRHYVLLNDPPPLVIENRATEDPRTPPAVTTPRLTFQGAPTDLMPDGTPPPRRRRNPRSGPDDGNGGGAQGANGTPLQRPAGSTSQAPAASAPQAPASSAPQAPAVSAAPAPAASGSQSPVPIAPRRRAALTAQRRAVYFAARGLPARRRNIDRY